LDLRDRAGLVKDDFPQQVSTAIKKRILIA
jgi:hypothetical protein